LGSADIISAECHPSQTVHLSVSSVKSKQHQFRREVLHWRLNLILRLSLKRLLPTLYNKTNVTTTGYSKVSRGLRVPLEISGLHTRKGFSGVSIQGQWRSRYTIHAGRHSNGKAFRYLKRVIVTPAVYQPLALLEKSFGY